MIGQQQLFQFCFSMQNFQMIFKTFLEQFGEIQKVFDLDSKKFMKFHRSALKSSLKQNFANQEKILPFNPRFYQSSALYNLYKLGQAHQMEKEFEVERISTDSKSVSKNIQRNQRKIGCWSKQQQKKYIEFLSFFRKSLQSRQQRKNNKVFKQMAEFIGSRDGIQCRSHHMKQLRTHKQVRKIISYYTQTSDNSYNQQPQGVLSLKSNQYQQQNVYNQLIWNNVARNQKEEQNQKQTDHFSNSFFPQQNINIFPSYSQFQIEPYQYCFLMYTPEQSLYQVYNIQ